MKKEETTPDCPTTTPRGSGSTPLCSRACCPAAPSTATELHLHKPLQPPRIFTQAATHPAVHHRLPPTVSSSHHSNLALSLQSTPLVKTKWQTPLISKLNRNSQDIQLYNQDHNKYCYVLYCDCYCRQSHSVPHYNDVTNIKYGTQIPKMQQQQRWNDDDDDDYDDDDDDKDTRDSVHLLIILYISIPHPLQSLSTFTNLQVKLSFQDCSVYSCSSKQYSVS
jgi:hypothetical protein